MIAGAAVAVADADAVEAGRLGGLAGCVIVEMGVGEGEDEYDSVCCMMSHLCCSLSFYLSLSLVRRARQLRGGTRLIRFNAFSLKSP